MSSYSIYKRVVVTSVGLEVLDDKFALIDDKNIQRYEMINTISIGYKSIVVAVSDGKYFLPNDNLSYTLTKGLEALNKINEALNSDDVTNQ